MRKNIVAGNWKMNTTVPEGVQLAKEVKDAVAQVADLKCDVVVGVPFTHLTAVKSVLEGGKVLLSAENCADHEKGAYTGEVSAPMVASTGADYAILGHSERRGYYNETIEMLKTKVDLALAAGLKVIFCCGESLDERKSGMYFEIIKEEIMGSLFHLDADAFANIVIAYEPIWAIGTGETATADQAEEIHAFIRKLIADKYGAQVADDTTILYGGSCKPSNAAELFAKPDIDGGLIGGASLKAADFLGIVTAF
ncbi:MAG: triose-phosphate isomerase [Muribaculaceae bacterium]|nr:triose-phosphate isomerase [Muribaculaceae bacterium]